MLVPTEFINQCKEIGVDKNTAVSYFTNKTNKKPTSSLLASYVPSVFKTLAEANSKLLLVFKNYNSKSNQTGKIETQIKIKDSDYIEQARNVLEASLGKFKEPKVTAKKSVSSTKKIVIASDFHIPFHSEKALKELLKQDAETLIIAGDFADMFCASRHVKDTSWISMKEEMASLRAVAELISENFKEVYWINGNHDCFDDQTEVMVKNGWKKFEDLYNSPEPVGVLTKEGLINFEMPTRVIYKPYKGKMIKFKTSLNSMVVTPNHRMAVVKRTLNKKDTGLKEISALDLHNNKGLIYYPVSATQPNQKDLNNVSDLELQLLGWLLTDGQIKQPLNEKQRGSIVYYQSGTKHLLIKNLLDLAQIKYNLVARNRDIKNICGKELKNKPQIGYEFRLGVKESTRFLKLLPTKNIQDWMYNLSERQISILLESINLGDGTYYKNRSVKSFCINGTKNELEQYQRLFITFGYRCNLIEYRENSWRLNILKQSYSSITPQNSSSEIDYDGWVGCATVPSDTLVVRREGRTFITHNCNSNKRILENLPHLGIGNSFNLLELITMGIKNFKPLSWEVKGTKAHTKFAEDETLKQFAMFGDIAICHFDHFTGAEAAIKANTFLDTWSHILKLPTEPRVVLHGHTHRLNLSYTPQGRVLISSGCMAQAQGYQLQQAGKYQPPTVGFITLEQVNGITDINSIRTVFIG